MSSPSKRSATTRTLPALPTAQQLGKNKLESSCLSLTEAKSLGIEVLEADAARALHPKATQPALLIKYFRPDGVLRDDVWRLRLLGPVTNKFGAVHPWRYLQPANTPPAAYFPNSIPWPSVITDPTVQILLTEGELKSCCAARHGHGHGGYACIGLGGVWSFKSTRLGWPLLPELEEIVWAGRDTVLVFDSDAHTKPEVQLALRHLSLELTRRGAKVRVARLPEIEQP